ncbi:UNVERIFIED_ORG: phosphoglycerate dehydrogenase-like enzyme [Paraburkholderia sediminicola]|uniref:D-2-hydroxyacid dehydrogenase family protein n=1 Tax=Paraburkholderia TaxID=1822464 RepID=UPI002112F514|nr:MULTISPECIES: D-2-hydroxyacid dehydrogenase family protein [Paraburkholderia]MCP2088938.1 phosphoglycerate dehydrogenase-like enzyme [Paraburkholderia sediminicola]MCX4136830.1 D-2-hydroxyacid dehydrogenase family protein [Paraburkholderia aspalathi]MDN7169522.1 D-2-hydroxyacid dehydrogenase family protein [Paraburkholderia sp. SEWSISQ10-3 4]MDQ6499161.1 D-2-hydroxyacid dehydrogenase family protein [Paraburkholderia aspalathi]
MNPKLPIKVAVLDDYQNVALSVADWSPLKDLADVTVFNDHVADIGSLIQRLQPFDVVCVMRERTPLSRVVIESLPNLKLIASTGPGNVSIDQEAAAERGIEIRHTGYSSTPTIEMTWALILAMARNIPLETQSVREGGWQLSLGEQLAGKTLGVLGLGHIGSAVGVIGRAFRMNVIAWSENLTEERAAEKGVQRVSKDVLFSTSDFLSIHLRFSERTRGLVGATELAQMKSTSRLINTSRGAIVDNAALLRALTTGQIAGAALDVYEVEPLENPHPLRELPNVLATPHIGYVSKELYRTFYGDTVQNIVKWLEETGRSA